METQPLSGESTRIESASSAASSQQIEEDSQYFAFHDVTGISKKPKRPKKGGLVEKLDLAMKKLTSERILCQHLPEKIRGGKEKSKKNAQVLNIYHSFSKVILTCLDYQLENGQRKTFDLILEITPELKSKKICENCDIKIEGPWLSFQIPQENQVITNVFKFSVINSTEKQEKVLEKQVLLTKS